jgi:pyruvate dehydrogenase (quinone)
VKVVVLRNDALAFVELEMKAAGILDFGTDIDNPDFAKMAEAAGLPGLTAERPEHAASGLGRVYPRTGAVWPTRA